MNFFNNMVVGAFSVSQASQKAYQWIETELQKGFLVNFAKGLFVLGIIAIAIGIVNRFKQQKSPIWNMLNGFIVAGLALLFIDGGVWAGNVVKGVIETIKAWFTI